MHSGMTATGGSPVDEYRRRKASRQAEVDAAVARSQRLSWARVASFVLTVLAIVAAAGHRAPGWLVALPVALFFGLVIVHERAERAQRRARRAVAYWEAGLQRLNEEWAGRGVKGERYHDDAHPYARDLDLFGHGSLFERLCSARTRAGEETLARWLTEPAAASEARARQAAVRELRGCLELREALALSGEEVRAEVDPGGLARWGAAPPVLVGRSAWIGVGLLTLVSAATLAGWLATVWSWLWLLPVALVVAVVMRLYRDRIAAIHAGVDRPARDLEVLALVVERFERERFDSPRLRALAEGLSRPGGESASRQVTRLARRVAFADAQRNQLFAPLGWLLLWPVHFGYAIEAWRADAGAEVARWLEIIGELEALAALAGYAYERPDDVWPEIVDAGARVEAEGLGHPLLPSERCVRNDVALGDPLRLLVISGSNMSGKSTLLRTIGVNVVLALAGAPVRAHRMTVSPVQIGATLRIQDSLAEGASRFYAEITRLKQLVDLSRGARPLLFLIDEILAGTNSHDRQLGAAAVVRGLVEKGAIGLVTTHDLALAEVATGLGDRAANVHFEDRMVDGRLQFDYRMRPGVVQHSNAIALMRAIGLEV